MNVETIYKDKLKGKYKFMFDLKEKQKCLIKPPKTSSVKRKQTKHVFAVYK
jgi:hypothetical protein